MDFTKLFFLPIVASAHGHEIDMMIYLVHLLMFILLFGWAVYFIYVLFRFRRNKNPQANYHGTTSHFSSYIEAAVAIVEVILLVGFSIPFWAKQVNALPTRPDKIEVRVVAEQFAWNIHYPGADGKFGRTNIEFFDKQSNPLGLDSSDPNGKDDIVNINQLHLPIGRPVIIHLSSKDVMHSFSLPIMRVKQDVIPGMSIPTWFIPTKTGQWQIGCAQLCGLGHYRMIGFITVHSQEGYQKWLDEQAPALGGSEEGGADDFWN
ncbi:MAG TPA: cytochrome c oxidase subunit II [Candidatus Omnitrophota bacterium]|nr:cytochrome c oxidase subunit II [Candidatus Omnitrophota bacterium]